MLTLVAPVFSSTEDNNDDDAYSIGCHIDNIIMLCISITNISNAWTFFGPSNLFIIVIQNREKRRTNFELTSYTTGNVCYVLTNRKKTRDKLKYEYENYALLLAQSESCPNFIFQGISDNLI